MVYRHFALTDINNTSACLEVVRLSKKQDIKPVLGVDFRNGAQQEFVILARNNNGFLNINNYLSELLHQPRFKVPQQAPFLEDTFVIYPFGKQGQFELKDHEFLGISPFEVNHLLFSKWNKRLDKLVVLQTVSFENKKGFNAHRLLRAIDNNLLLSKLPKEEQGREEHIMLSNCHFKSIF